MNNMGTRIHPRKPAMLRCEKEESNKVYTKWKTRVSREIGPKKERLRDRNTNNGSSRQIISIPHRKPGLFKTNSCIPVSKRISRERSRRLVKNTG